MRPLIKTYCPSRDYRFAHLKRDGIWLTIIHTRAAGPKAYTRHPTDITDKLWRHHSFEQFHCLSEPGDELFCELFAPGQPASMVKSWLSDGRANDLHIDVFASPTLSTLAPLDEVEKFAKELAQSFAPFRPMVEHLDSPDWWRQHADVEGVVFKDGNLENWAKYKDTLTTDLVVTGFTEGRGKYEGQIGALECSLYIGSNTDEYDHICNVSGMDDATRWEISQDPERFLHQVVEIAYQRVDSAGGLRHPRFVRWRDDKTVVECTKV